MRLIPRVPREGVHSTRAHVAQNRGRDAGVSPLPPLPAPPLAIRAQAVFSHSGELSYQLYLRVPIRFWLTFACVLACLLKACL